VRFVKVIASINRGMKALRASLQRRGMIYVTALTLMITFVGAGGLFGFEQGNNSGFGSYGESLWRTAMIITTMGTGTEPKSMEGRALVLLLALYSFAIFGYITASLATFFVGRDAQENRDGVAGQQSMDALRDEIRALRAEIERKSGTGPPA
jgi:voltage-gated potassium channel